MDGRRPDGREPLARRTLRLPRPTEHRLAAERDKAAEARRRSDRFSLGELDRWS